VTLSDIANYINARASSGHSGKLKADVGAFGASVTHDSRRAMPGGIFVAITGAQADGNHFVGDATKRGAIAIVSEQPRPADFTGVWMQVANAREALAKAAALVHGHPSRQLVLVGLTGTNGKTTTSYLVNSIFAAAGKKTAVMGTIGYSIGDEKVDAEYTTPEASEIQNFLRRAVESGVTHAVMEVSSIALEMHRADELEFAAAAFSNLTQDHLDFHGTMENYFAAKKKLFDGQIGKRPNHAILNLDDPYGAQLKEMCGTTALTYALDADDWKDYASRRELRRGRSKSHRHWLGVRTRTIRCVRLALVCHWALIRTRLPAASINAPESPVGSNGFPAWMAAMTLQLWWITRIRRTRWSTR
jgi:UDP-N-acetylmuramoyl-L-alanyl-D-glutamate--2,6-diaminopimelate ligase